MKIDTSSKSSHQYPTSTTENSQSKPRSYTINLPSGGRLYGGRSSVEASFFTTLDVKRLYDITKGTKTDSIEKLIGSKIDLNIEELTISDFWYVLYWVRINSFEKHPLKVEWTCKKLKKGDTCSTVNDSLIEGSNLVVEELDKEYKEPVTLKLPVHGDIKVKLRRVSDTIVADKLVDTKFNGKASEGDQWFIKLASSIDNGQSLYENYLLVSKLDPDDLMYLDSFESTYSYGVRTVVKVACKDCQEVSLIPFQIALEHFFPSNQSSSNFRNAIRFSDAS